MFPAADDQGCGCELAGSERAVVLRSRIWGQHDQQFLLAERMGYEPLVAQWQVGGAEFAGTIANQRSYAVCALELEYAHLDAGWRSRKRPIRWPWGRPRVSPAPRSRAFRCAVRSRR